MARSVLDCSACFRRITQVLSPANATPRLYSTRRLATVSRADAPQTLKAETSDPSEAKNRSKEKLEFAVKKHLRHLSDDPWAIGQYVEKALARDAFDEALLLVQRASRKEKQVVVAWNHLIDYQLQRQQMKRAFKIYNDMKKRSQLPNVKTLTIIFRGLAKSQHPKMAVAEAVKHYNVLLNDSRLEPNSIHLNAVLNVCARAGDLDNLFLVANSVNESTRAATAFTYTTILNALRHNALNEAKGLPLDQQQANIEKLLDRAKGLWGEVIHKWTSGKLVIDEELVCAMGRLLLMTPKKGDRCQVFSLLEQTMSIPDLVRNPGAAAHTDQSMQNIAASGASKPVPSSRRSVYAVPARNTLALVLTTLASTRQTTAGIKYWNLMVRHYGVIPDNDNWLRMFGMLKVAKSSGHASNILDIMPDEYMDGKPFRIAMEACVRDNLNENVVKNATKVLDSMLERLKIPDLHALRLYLRVSLVSHNHLRAKFKNGEQDEAKRMYGVQITEALARLWEPYKQTHYHYFRAAKPKDESGEKAIYNGKREVIALARHMISAFNKVINEKMLPENDLEELKPIGAKINREIQKFYADREIHEPNLPSTKEATSETAGQETGEAQDKKTGETTTENIEDDNDLSIKQGGEWVWDTYRTTIPEKEPYPWESSPREAILAPLSSNSKRGKANRRRQ